MWVGKDNLRMMPRCLVWTSEEIVISSAKSNVQKQQQVWECKIMSTALDKLSFWCLVAIKVLSTRQLDIWASALDGGVDWKKRLGSHQHLVKGLSSGNSSESSKIHFISNRPNTYQELFCVKMVHSSIRKL